MWHMGLWLQKKLPSEPLWNKGIIDINQRVLFSIGLCYRAGALETPVFHSLCMSP